MFSHVFLDNVMLKADKVPTLISELLKPTALTTIVWLSDALIRKLPLPSPSTVVFEPFTWIETFGIPAPCSSFTDPVIVRTWAEAAIEDNSKAKIK